MLKINIKNALDFIYSLLGTKYGWWNIAPLDLKEIKEAPRDSK